MNARVRRRDEGMTLIELTVVIVMIGVLSAVIAAAISVIFRSERSVATIVGESHDTQQGVNYFPLDVQSGPADIAAYVVNVGSGCSTTGADNALTIEYGNRSVAYRRTVTATSAHLDRYECDSVGNAISVINVADQLDRSTASVAEAAVIATAADPTLVDRVTLRLAQVGAPSKLEASPRAEPVVDVALGDCSGDSPVEATHGFGAFIEGDVTLHGEQVLGTLALGGDLRWTKTFSVANNSKNAAPYQDISLFAGSVDWDESADDLQVNGGDVVLGDGTYGASGDYAVDPTVPISAARIDVKKDLLSSSSVTAIDFAVDFNELRKCSAHLATLPDLASCPATIADCPDPIVVSDFDNAANPVSPSTLKLRLTWGNNHGAQVLNIPESYLIAGRGYDPSPNNLSGSRSALINIIEDPSDGDEHVDFVFNNSGWPNGKDTRVLFNFPNATSVNVIGELHGTVLAPFATVTTNGNQHGGVIAREWIQNPGFTTDNANNKLYAEDVFGPFP